MDASGIYDDDFAYVLKSGLYRSSLRVSMVIDPPQTDAAALAAVWIMCNPTVTSALLQAAKVGAFPVAELE